MEIAEAVAVARQSVVRVDAGPSQGSGVVFAPGFIISNAHVVGRESSVLLVDERGREATGTVPWRSRGLDLAVIAIADESWPPISIAQVSQLREGEEVFALGHPLGLSFTVTRGIVSARAREFRGQIYIQTDAAINPGNSGGPLLDRRGRLLGINTFLLTSSIGLNFAIPIDRALASAQKAMSAQETGVDLACHSCESPVPKGHPYCPYCGTWIRTDNGRGELGVRSANTPQPVSHTGGSCPSCHSTGRFNTKYCDVCGTVIRR